MRPIEEFIKSRKNIIHGRKALNRQMPQRYWRETKDWDLFSNSIKKDSDKLQKFLDKKVGSDRFYAKKTPLADSKRKVWKVIDRDNEQEVADFMSTPKSKNLYTTIDGLRFEKLQKAKKIYKKILNNPKLAHRHAKAMYDLNSIEAYERELKQETTQQLDKEFSLF